jgi:hypothetical protein
MNKIKGSVRMANRVLAWDFWADAADNGENPNSRGEWKS